MRIRLILLVFKEQGSWVLHST